MATFLINYSSIKPAQYKIKSLEERLKEKDNTIKEQRLQLKDEMYMIAGKYGDFSNFIKQEKVTDFLGKIVNNFTYIEAIQVHSFNMMVDDESIVFKLIYDNSYAKEGVSINNINQQYYKVNKYIYTNFKRTIDYYKIYLDSFDKEIASSIVDHAVDILIDISDDYTSEHRRIFDILLSIIEDLNPDENIEGINDLSIQEYEQEGDDSSPEIIIENYDEIIDFKRTGILGSILMNADYMYEYEKINNSKMHRKYFHFMMNLIMKIKLLL